MDKHIYEARTVTFVETKFRMKWYLKKHFLKSTSIILVPSQRYQDSGHLLQHPKVPKNVMDFNNRAQRFTTPYYLDVDNPFYFLGGIIFFLICSFIRIP